MRNPYLESWLSLELCRTLVSMRGSLGLRPMMLVKFYCRCRFPAGKEGASRLGVECRGTGVLDRSGLN